MTGDRPAASATHPRVWWTRGQLLFVVGQFLVLLATSAVLLLIRADRASLLWTDPQRRKLVTVMGIMLAGDFGSFLLIGLLLNRLVPFTDPHALGVRRAIQGVVGVILLMFLFLPALYVLVIGFS
jgi:hypothetical protein